MIETQNIIEKINFIADKNFDNFSEFAEKMNLKRQTLYYQLKGNSKMPLEVFLHICRKLKKSPCDFFDCKKQRGKNYNVSSIKLSGGSVFSNTLGDNNNMVAEPPAEYRTKKELSEKDIKELQDNCNNTTLELKAAYTEIVRLKKQNDANLELIDLLRNS